VRSLEGPPFDAWRVPREKFVAGLPPDVRKRWIEINGHAVDDARNGMFQIPERLLMVIASNGGLWDHVSVSHRDRIPTWEEMEWVKRTFFMAGETAMQLHVPVRDHINNNPMVLHIWRPHNRKIPTPPKSYV
jgi:hypothetical protein